jgi:hypothetical protein
MHRIKRPCERGAPSSKSTIAPEALGQSLNPRIDFQMRKVAFEALPRIAASTIAKF